MPNEPTAAPAVPIGTDEAFTSVPATAASAATVSIAMLTTPGSHATCYSLRARHPPTVEHPTPHRHASPDPHAHEGAARH